MSNYCQIFFELFSELAFPYLETGVGQGSANVDVTGNLTGKC